MTPSSIGKGGTKKGVISNSSRGVKKGDSTTSNKKNGREGKKEISKFFLWESGQVYALPDIPRGKKHKKAKR